MNKRGSNVVDITARLPRSNSFKSVGVLLSAVQSGSISSDDKRLLLAKIREKIKTLKQELDSDGKGLDARVRSYLLTIAGGQEDELSGSGVDFRVPERKLEISLAAGEADKKSASKKIERIVAACGELAAQDLEFLEAASTKLKTSELESADIERLKTVLEQNTYWRYLEAN